MGLGSGEGSTVLRQRSRKLRFSPPEVVGSILILLAVAAGGRWWHNNTQAAWHETSGYVVAVQPRAPASRGKETPSEPGEVDILYRYQVGQESYMGCWSGTRPKAARLIATAQERNDLAFPGAAILINYDNFPEPVQDFLRTKGMYNSSDVIAKVNEFLYGNRNISLYDFPDHVLAALRERDDEPTFSGPTPALAHSGSPEDEPYRNRPAAGRRVDATLPSVAQSMPTRVWARTNTSPATSAFRVAYDPNNPSRNFLRGSASASHMAHATLSLGAFALVLAYFVFVYPAWKRRA